MSDKETAPWQREAAKEYIDGKVWLDQEPKEIEYLAKIIAKHAVECTAQAPTQPAFPAILERERTLVAEGVTNVKKAIQCREWLTEGRGSYEWNDDRWHGEFAAAISEILTAIQPLERIAADWTNCPQKWEDVQKARKATPQGTPDKCPVCYSDNRKRRDLANSVCGQSEDHDFECFCTDPWHSAETTGLFPPNSSKNWQTP